MLNARSMVEEKQVFPPFLEGRAQVKDMEEYETMYSHSMVDPEAYWADRASELVDWYHTWDRVLDPGTPLPDAKWFVGAKLNAAHNCVDRHVAGPRRNKAAFIWQGEPEEDVRVYTYQMLLSEICRFANVLKKHGVTRGDRVCLYLPVIPELPVAMLACARIGAVHSVVFSGYSAASLGRLLRDSKAKVLVTADGAWRAGRVIPLKRYADEAMASCPEMETCIVVPRVKSNPGMTEGRDMWWSEAMNAEDVSDSCPCVEMDAEDMLFILHASGGSDNPKGLAHATGGFLTYAAHTAKLVFDIRDEDVFFSTSDLGWITGHTYGVYGPLATGATALLYEGTSTHPEPDRLWRIVNKFKATIFYTTPSTIRSLMREGTEWAQKRDTSSLRILGSVGEPISPEAWRWYRKHVGYDRLPLVDTWWQAETGGVLISPLPYATPLKPGSVGRPLPGVDAAVVNGEGLEAEANENGYLVVRKPWPGMFRCVFNDPGSCKSDYFSRFPGMFETGDGARRDEDGDFWISGRVDDVVKTSGVRLGATEVEAALSSHPAVAEVAVVAVPHEVKGEGTHAYVTLKENFTEGTALSEELLEWVRKEIGPVAAPEAIHFTQGLPKTRSGKIVRKALRKAAVGGLDVEDAAGLEDPSVLTSLFEGKKGLFD